MVVIAGRGKSFSAGGDLGEMKVAGQASLKRNQTAAVSVKLMRHRAFDSVISNRL